MNASDCSENWHGAFGTDGPARTCDSSSERRQPGIGDAPAVPAHRGCSFVRSATNSCCSLGACHIRTLCKSTVVKRLSKKKGNETTTHTNPCGSATVLTLQTAHPPSLDAPETQSPPALPSPSLAAAQPATVGRGRPHSPHRTWRRPLLPTPPQPSHQQLAPRHHGTPCARR